MANFAIIDGDTVINTIIAESKSIAEEITGKTCVEYSSSDKAEMGGTYKNNTFIPKKPFDSWLLVDNQWVAPVDYPSDEKNYLWNEATTSWAEDLAE